jgi:hypothetical protein
VACRSYQSRVVDWLVACFPPSAPSDCVERTHRFLEEALELAQASGCSRDEALKLVEYVYSRPSGDVQQEVGGVMVTLAGLCYASGVEMDKAGDVELERNWRRTDAIRRKQAARPNGSPLPQ